MAVHEQLSGHKGVLTSRMESMVIGVLAAVSALMPRLPTCTCHHKVS